MKAHTSMRKPAKVVAVIAAVEIMALCASVCVRVLDAAEPPYTLPVEYREYWAGLDAATLSNVIESIQEEIIDLQERMAARIDDLVYVQGVQAGKLAEARPPP